MRDTGGAVPRHVRVDGRRFGRRRVGGFGRQDKIPVDALFRHKRCPELAHARFVVVAATAALGETQRTRRAFAGTRSVCGKGEPARARARVRD